MITSQGYIDEVKLRLARHEVATILDDPMILTYVNKARRMVQRQTIALTPEQYSVIAQIPLLATMITPDYQQNDSYALKNISVLTVPMPVDLINPEVVILQYRKDGRIYRQEARPVTKTELFSVNMHAYNVPTVDSPIYTTENLRHFDNLVTNSLVMYFVGIDYGSQTLFDVAYALFLEIWYTFALPDLEWVNAAGTHDAEFFIQQDVEELVILYASLYCMQTVDAVQAVMSTQADIASMEGLVTETYGIETDIQPTLLPSKEGL